MEIQRQGLHMIQEYSVQSFASKSVIVTPPLQNWMLIMIDHISWTFKYKNLLYMFSYATEYFVQTES
jgi:hypothetical protein